MSGRSLSHQRSAHPTNTIHFKVPPSKIILWFKPAGFSTRQAVAGCYTYTVTKQGKDRLGLFRAECKRIGTHTGIKIKYFDTGLDAQMWLEGLAQKDAR
jgi:hypothetical protein